jgi:hypothetical protein
VAGTPPLGGFKYQDSRIPLDFDVFKQAAIDRRAAVSPACAAAGVVTAGCLGAPPTPVTAAKQPGKKAPAGKNASAPQAPVITISPYEAAIIAMAQLPLKAATPGIGPPPELNKWRMAAVGYPLWLWAEGNSTPRPVSTTVQGLTVSLHASMTGIDYAMGDGTTVSCGRGTRWRRDAVAAGTPSPTCGHTYTKASLPKGSYTITATTHWNVAWTAGGQAGTIPFDQSSTRTLPVGELQVLVR